MTNRLGSIGGTDGFIQIPLRTAAAESSSLLSTCDDHGIKGEDLTVLVSPPRKFTEACSRFEQLASPLSAFAMHIRYLHD